MTNNGIILYPDMLEDAMSILSADEFTELMQIIINYKKTGNVPPNMSKIMTLAFLPFKQTMDINQERYDKKCQKNRENAQKRWNSNNEDDTNECERMPSNEKNANAYERMQSDANDANTNTNTNTNTDTNTNTNNKKENIKEKEPKIHFAEFVTMTNAEYEKLVSTYSKEFTDQCIKVLDNYKGSSGKKYKSDYRAILTWVIDEVKKRKKQTEAKQKTSNFTSRSYENLNDLYFNTGQKVGKNE